MLICIFPSNATDQSFFETSFTYAPLPFVLQLLSLLEFFTAFSPSPFFFSLHLDHILKLEDKVARKEGMHEKETRARKKGHAKARRKSGQGRSRSDKRDQQ